MSTTKQYRDYVVEQLSELPNIVCRPMMGGYLLYSDGILFGGLYGGDRLLVKMVPENAQFGMREEIPYEGSKKLMYLVEDTDNKEKLTEIVKATVRGLK